MKTLSGINIVILITLIVAYSLNISGNHGALFAYSDYNFLTSISLYNFKLHLPIDPSSGIPNDLQFYNGKIYSNWGYVVPFLQLPFHSVTLFIFNKPCPDILIFIFYSILTCKILLNYLKKVINLNELNLSFVAILIYSSSLVWLLSYRFLIYEETTCYYTLLSICSVVYFFKYTKYYLISDCIKLAIILSLMYGIRQTTLIHLLLISIYIILNRIKSYKYFILYLVLFISPLLLLNYLKSGLIFGNPVFNTNPGITDELFYIKIGSPCVQLNIDLIIYRIRTFFMNIFVRPTDIQGYVQNGCFITFEDSKMFMRPYFSNIIIIYSFLYFGIVLLKGQYNDKNLINIIKYFYKYLFPFFGIFSLVVLYGVFANGFAYRYFVDFIFFILILIHPFLIYILNCPFRKLILLIVFVYIYFINYTIANTQRDTVKTLKSRTVPLLNWNYDYNFPSVRNCKDSKIFEKDKFGWNQNCKIDKYINIYTSVTHLSESNIYEIKMNGENIPDLVDIRINGKMFKNHNWKNSKLFLPLDNNNLNIFVFFKNVKSVSLFEISLIS